MNLLPLLLVFLVLCGCQQQMAEQPYHRALDASSFFADGRSARDPVTGTVAQGQLHADRVFYTGLRSDAPEAQPGSEAREVGLSVSRTDLDQRPYVDQLPKESLQREGKAKDPSLEREAMLKLVRRGQERFGVFCDVCHDPRGQGQGIVVQRGFTQPPTYHSDRLRRAPLGYFFDVISRGYGSMPDYAAQVAPADRWAIATYIRALQLSEHAELDRLTPSQAGEIRGQLEKTRP